jgi:hypothetical protein
MEMLLEDKNDITGTSSITSGIFPSQVTLLT